MKAEIAYSAQHNLFLKKACLLKKKLKQIGYRSINPSQEFENRFLQSTKEQLNNSINAFDGFLNLVEHIESNQKSESPFNHLQITWYALSKLGLTPGFDLFAQLENNDIIEVYDNSGIQAFCSFNFFNFCSYSLEELHLYSWDELYKRSPFIIKQMQINAQAILSGKKISTENAITDHYCLELNSTDKRLLKCQIKATWPLLDSDKNIAAFITTSKLEIVKEHCKLEDHKHLFT